MTLVSVFTDHIRQDRLRDYEDHVTALAAAARKKKEAWHWTAHQVGFGSLARIYYTSTHPDYADLEKRGDALALFTRALGEKRGPKHLDEVSECLVSSQRAIGRHRTELSYPKEPPRKIAPMTSLAMVRARPGRQDAVEALLHKVAEAVPKAGEAARIDAFQALTGDMLVYWLVRPLTRLSDLDRQSIGQDLLVKAYGKDEGTRAFQSGLEGVAELRREILSFREDLSNPAS